MKNIAYIALALSLSSSSFTENVCAADEISDNIIDRSNNSWSAFRTKATERVGALSESNDALQTRLTALKEEISQIEGEAKQSQTTIDFFKNVQTVADKFGPVDALCEDILKNDLKGVTETDYGALNTALKGFNDQMFRDEKPIRIGENVILLPGLHVSSLNDKTTVEITHTRHDDVSYWTMANGQKGRNSVLDKTEIEDEAYSVVVFEGSKRKPDGTTLIIQKAPENFNAQKQQLCFANLLNPNTETIQADTKAPLPEFTLKQSFGDQKEIALSIPRSIMTSLGVLAAASQEDRANMESVYTMLVHGVTELRKRIDTIHTQIEAWAQEIDAPKENLPQNNAIAD